MTTTNIPDGLAEMEMSANARKVFEQRYVRKNEDGLPAETPQQTLWRVASAVADPDWKDGEEAYLRTAREFFDAMVDRRFMPNSPTFTGAGTPLAQLSACFVLPIKDDMGKLNGGIFDTLRDAALIQQTGGGNGFDFSSLRPRGALVRSSMGKATGPVGFMRIYDVAFGEICQGGSRRGANMGLLRVDHPDILEFIRCKAKEGEMTNFNISVAITDKFMESLESGSPFDLVFDGTVYKTVDARELWDEIVRHAHRNGEPGLFFVDEANRKNPLPHLYTIAACNPCGEQPMGPYDSCGLGSVNLSKFVSGGHILWDELAKTVRTAVRFLDNAIEVNNYVPAVPELAEMAHRGRRIGLGIMGLADMFYMLGIRYGEQDSLWLAGNLMRFIRFHAMDASVDLARENVVYGEDGREIAEIGAFPTIHGSIYDPEDFKFRYEDYAIPLSRVGALGEFLDENPSMSDHLRPPLSVDDWYDLAERIKKYGIRNGCQISVAPTGTIATVAGVDGYGCEPVFALVHTRWLTTELGRVPMAYVSPLFREALIAARLAPHTRRRIIEDTSRTGSCQNVQGVPDFIRNVFVTASDISVEDHIHMQAVIQAATDTAVSKTINFPETATESDVANGYMLAWKLGCKGITVYVAGSREIVVLETQHTQARASTEECPQCQSRTLVHSEGCQKCLVCEYAACA